MILPPIDQTPLPVLKSTSALKEGVLELLRTALMAIVPLVLIAVQTGKWDSKVIMTAGVVALLSGIDKWLYKSATKVSGLVPF